MIVQIIGWYCLVIGCFIGIALVFVNSVNKTSEYNLRVVVLWIVHVAMLGVTVLAWK